MSRRQYTWNAFETTLSGPITAGATIIGLTSVVNLRAPGLLVINPDDAGLREYFSFTSINASNLEGCTRGLGGSAAGAQAQSAGAVVRSVMMHQFIDDTFSDIEDLETWDTNHLAASNPHSIYLTEAEGDTIYVEQSNHTKAAHDALNIDADTLDGSDSTAFANTVHDHGSEAGSTIEPDDTPAAGVSGNYSRGDHAHGIGAATPGSILPDAGAAEGVSTSFSRADHTHGISAAVPGTQGIEAAAEGVATSFARSDHVHALDAAEAGDVADIGATTGAGSSTEIPRADHAHTIDDMELFVLSATNEDVSQTALTGSWTDQVTLSFVLPASWDSALIVAWGSAYISGYDNSNRVGVRVEIGANNGPTMGSPASGIGTNSANTFQATHSLAVVTGNVTIATAAWQVTGSTSDCEHSTITYLALRTPLGG